jgi:transposase
VRFETDPGVQVQADWADCGQWLVGEELCTLHALVAVLGFSPMVAVRFATDTTHPTTLGLLTECLVDLGGAPTEVLTDRDPALVIGSTPSGRPVLPLSGSTWPRCSACARGHVGRTGPRPRARSNG